MGNASEADRGLSPLCRFFLAPRQTTATREDKFMFDTVWIRNRGDGISFSITGGSLTQTFFSGVATRGDDWNSGYLNAEIYCFIYLFIFNGVKTFKFQLPGLACYNHWAMGNPSEIIEKI